MKRIELAGMLKVITQNLKFLHRNVHGNDFFNTHEHLDEYYKTVDDITDEYIETFLTLDGFYEPSLEESIKYYPEEKSSIECDIAFALAQKYFNDLVEKFAEIKSTVPDFVSAKIDEWQLTLYKHANYFIQKRLS